MEQLHIALCRQYTKEANKELCTTKQCMMNKEQRAVVLYNRQWCKCAAAALRQAMTEPACYLFLSGPGGTGKSPQCLHLLEIYWNLKTLLEISLNLMVHLEIFV